MAAPAAPKAKRKAAARRTPAKPEPTCTPDESRAPTPPSASPPDTRDLGGTAGAIYGIDSPSEEAAAQARQSKKKGKRHLEAGPPVIDPARPSWGVYEHWVMVGNRRLRPGVYWHTTRTDAEGERHNSDEWISTPVTVTARTVRTEDDSEGRLLRLVTNRGVREWVMPMEVFGGSGEEARRTLFNMGVIIALKKRGAFMEYLLDQQPAITLATTTRPGWHESGAFVLPERTIGSDQVRYQAVGNSPTLFSQRGELAQWQAQVAAKCVGNPVLTLAVGCALAGPLLNLVGVQGGGVHLIGDSSSGKSLAQLVGSSVWGDPGVFVASWDLSKGGLEIEAASRNDTVLPLDEIKRVDPRRVQEMVYALANGQGKGTMNRERGGAPKLTWRTLALSSGERSLSDHAAMGGNPAHAGAELRMVDVDAGGRTYRAFDDLHGLEGAEFHRALTLAVRSHHGHVGPAFVERLLAGNDMAGLAEDFAGIRLHFAEDNAQAGRVADRFAVIAMAGEMAIAYGLLPWKPGSALRDCCLLYGEWLAKVGGGNAEDRQILGSLRDYIDRYGDSRFSNIADHSPDSKVTVRAGYWEVVNGKHLFLFLGTGLKEAAPGFSVTRIAKALDSAGAIVERDIENGRRRNTKKRRTPGDPKNLYVIDPQCLGDE